MNDDTPSNEVNEAMPQYGRTSFTSPNQMWDQDPLPLINRAKKGVSMEKLKQIGVRLGLNLEEFSEVLHISMRTLQRKSAQDILSVPISERLLQLELVAGQGEYVFSNSETFKSWLQEPLFSLGHASPKSLLDTTFGIQMITKTLGRLAYGVYS